MTTMELLRGSYKSYAQDQNPCSHLSFKWNRMFGIASQTCEEGEEICVEELGGMVFCR